MKKLLNIVITLLILTVHVNAQVYTNKPVGEKNQALLTA